MKRLALQLSLVCLLLSVTGAASAKENYVHLIGPIGLPRAAHSATLLPNGTVLIAGGMQEDGVSTSETTLYLPARMEFWPGPAMSVARAGHTATTLNDFRVLILGGYDGREPVSAAEYYDPFDRAFVTIGDSPVAGDGFTATLLEDGRVLIAGSGFKGAKASAFLFDPETAQFTPTGSLNVARAAHTATRLQDGRVLIAGGSDGKDVVTVSEIYDPATGQFSLAGELLTARHKHGAALMEDGRVLIVGGSDMRDWEGRTASAEIFDPATGRFEATSGMHHARFKLTDAVVTLENGMVLIAGGGMAEVYDPVRGIFTEVQGGLSTARHSATATRLSTGEVVIVGGYSEDMLVSDRAWLYIPAFEPS